MVNTHSPTRQTLGLDVTKMIDKVKSAYRNSIDANNGIKSDNLKTILFPIGIKPLDLDENWLSSMNDFGKERGLVAHHGQSVVRRLLDPVDERNRIQTLKAGILILDAKLITLGLI